MQPLLPPQLLWVNIRCRVSSGSVWSDSFLVPSHPLSLILPSSLLPSLLKAVSSGQSQAGNSGGNASSTTHSASTPQTRGSVPSPTLAPGVQGVTSHGVHQPVEFNHAINYVNKIKVGSSVNEEVAMVTNTCISSLWLLLRTLAIVYLYMCLINRQLINNYMYATLSQLANKQTCMSHTILFLSLFLSLRTVSSITQKSTRHSWRSSIPIRRNRGRSRKEGHPVTSLSVRRKSILKYQSCFTTRKTFCQSLGSSYLMLQLPSLWVSPASWVAMVSYEIWTQRGRGSVSWC